MTLSFLFLWIFGYANFFLAKKLPTRKNNFLKKNSLSCKRHWESAVALCFHCIFLQRKTPHTFSSNIIFDWLKENRMGPVQKENRDSNFTILSEGFDWCSSAMALMSHEWIYQMQSNPFELSFHVAETGMFCANRGSGFALWKPTKKPIWCFFSKFWKKFRIIKFHTLIL